MSRSTGRLLVVLSLIAGLSGLVLPVSADESVAEVEVAWTCETGVIEITSSKGISNLVLVVDGVDVRWFEAPAEDDEIRFYTIDPDTVDGAIWGIYVKSGNNGDPESMGFGEFFPLAEPDCGPVCDPFVEFADPNLEAAALRALNLDAGPITKTDAERLLALNAAGRSITDLGGIGCFVNLRSLVITGNGITDISEVSFLTNLFALVADDNQISDVSPLAGLTELRLLGLRRNQVRDISSLGNLTLMISFLFDGNDINDISVVVNYSDLETLSVSFNQIKDISPVEGLPNLRNLFLRSNAVLLTDISALLTVPLFSLADLRGSLDCTDPTTLEDLALLTSQGVLVIHGCTI